MRIKSVNVGWKSEATSDICFNADLFAGEMSEVAALFQPTWMIFLEIDLPIDQAPEHSTL